MKLRTFNELISLETFCEISSISSDELKIALQRFRTSEKSQNIFGFGDKCTVQLFDTSRQKSILVTLDLNEGIKVEEEGLNNEEVRLAKISACYTVYEIFVLPDDYIQNILTSD